MTCDSLETNNLPDLDVTIPREKMLNEKLRPIGMQIDIDCGQTLNLSALNMKLEILQSYWFFSSTRKRDTVSNLITT